MTEQYKVPLTDTLISTAHKFRFGKEAEAAQALRQCIDRLEPLSSQLPQATFMAYMSAILAAQERYDWLAIADTLEYELVQLLAQHPDIDSN